MRYLLKASGIAAAIAFMAIAPSAVAQEVTYTMTCQDVGAGAPEPLGDRQGHSISIKEGGCHVESGPMSVSGMRIPLLSGLREATRPARTGSASRTGAWL